MAKDLNKVQLTGRLGADVEMRYTSQGSAVATFRVASNRTWQTTEGEKREDTEWFSVVAWNKLAEICNQYLNKGTRVYIEGRSQTRSWQDDQGQTRYKTEIIANDMIILDGRREGMSYDAPEDHGDHWEEEPAPARPAARPAQAAPSTPPARSGNGNGNGNSSRPATRSAQPTATTRPAARKPVAVTEDDDLPF